MTKEQAARILNTWRQTAAAGSGKVTVTGSRYPAAMQSAVDTERAFLARLGGGCELPVGAYATVMADGTLHLVAMLASGDGSTVLRGERSDRRNATSSDP